MVTEALFKRIEEEGVAWLLAGLRRPGGMRTAEVTDSAITGPRQPGPARHMHHRRLCRRRRPVTVTPARKAPPGGHRRAEQARDRLPGKVITLSHLSLNANRRYVRQADLLLDLIHGDRTRRSARGLHSRLASDSAEMSAWHPRMMMPGSEYVCRIS